MKKVKDLYIKTQNGKQSADSMPNKPIGTVSADFLKAAGKGLNCHLLTWGTSNPM